MRGNHARFEHQTHAEAIDAHVVADGVQPFDALAYECGDQQLWNTAEAETAQHESRAIGNITYCFIGMCHQLMHRFSRSPATLVRDGAAIRPPSTSHRATARSPPRRLCALHPARF